MLGMGPNECPPFANQSDWLEGDLDAAVFEDWTDGEDGNGDFPEIENYLPFQFTWKLILEKRIFWN